MCLHTSYHYNNNAHNRTHLAVVPVLQGLLVQLHAAGACLQDEAVQALVDDLDVSSKRALTWHDGTQQRHVPVRDVKGGAVLGLCTAAESTAAAFVQNS
jgi:hypothetical protein